MRSVIFLAGIVMVVLGPLVTLASLSSCLATILSGHFLACVTDFVFVGFGGVLFVVGIITAIVGLVVPDSPSLSSPSPVPVASALPAEITCRKCGRAYNSDLFFCPSCGQRTG